MQNALQSNYLSEDEIANIDALSLWREGQEFTTSCPNCGQLSHGFTDYEEDAAGTFLYVAIECPCCGQTLNTRC